MEYLAELGKLVPTAPTPTERHVAEYRRYLDRVRGLATGTINMHVGTAAEFLRFLDHDTRPQRLCELRGADVEAFIAKTGKRVGRGRMGQITAALRTFLRFLAATGEVPTGLDARVDSPRIYRGERLPRAIPWEAVRAFLRSVDRSTPKGRRDFAIFLLIATYGLRSSEVRALNLDDFAWRARQFYVPRPKVGTPMLLPLTDEVVAALLDYLQHGRPKSACRQVFLRVEFPLGPLGQGTIGGAFHTWAQRAGTVLPARCGPHCLRHALALHLLRQGSALKTIGDILGHRSAESTGIYLRLDVDDLRDVALPLPIGAGAEAVRP
jgi:integrase